MKPVKLGLSDWAVMQWSVQTESDLLVETMQCVTVRQEVRVRRAGRHHLRHQPLHHHLPGEPSSHITATIMATCTLSACSGVQHIAFAAVGHLTSTSCPPVSLQRFAALCCLPQVPLVGALFTRVQHFDMIHYGSYLSAASPFWLVAFPQGALSGRCMAFALVIHTICTDRWILNLAARRHCVV